MAFPRNYPRPGGKPDIRQLSDGYSGARPRGSGHDKPVATKHVGPGPAVAVAESPFGVGPLARIAGRTRRELEAPTQRHEP